MQSQFNWFHSYDVAKAYQSEILREVAEYRRNHPAASASRRQDQAKRRFFNLYRLRSILFRLAPDWAARLEL